MREGLTGKSATVPGVSVPYEELENPEVAMESNKMNPEKCAKKILEAMMRKSNDLSLLRIRSLVGASALIIL